MSVITALNEYVPADNGMNPYEAVLPTPMPDMLFATIPLFVYIKFTVNGPVPFSMVVCSVVC